MSPSTSSDVRTGAAAPTHLVGTAPLAEGADTAPVRRFGSLRSLIVLLIGSMLALLLISSAATGIARWVVETAND